MSKKANKKRLILQIIIFLICLAVLIFLIGRFTKITGNAILTNYSDTKYAPPFNILEANAQVFSIAPEDIDSSDEIINLDVNISLPGGFIYKKGYVYMQENGSFKWEVFNFDQTPIKGSYWIPDFSSVSLVINSSLTLPIGENYIVTYACKKYDNEWKCGCNSLNDENCKRWMLQVFKVSGIPIPAATNNTCNNDSQCISGECVDNICTSPEVNQTIVPVSIPNGKHGISNCNQLQAINNNLYGDYVLQNNIDCSGNNDFVPIGTQTSPFQGTLNGNGFSINNLRISTSSEAGLFGSTQDSVIYNLGLTNLQLNGNREGFSAGGLIDHAVNTKIYNSFVLGNINSNGWYTGGLVGFGNDIIINNSYFTGSIVCSNCVVGGLIGNLQYSYTSSNLCQIINSYANANLTVSPDQTGVGMSRVGGLVGVAGSNSLNIINSYFTGNLSGSYKGGILSDADFVNLQVLNSFSAVDSKAFAYLNYAQDLGVAFPTLSNIFWYRSSPNNHCYTYYSDDFHEGDSGCSPISDLAYFKNKSNPPLSTWDFTNTWKISSGVNNGYPYLQKKSSNFINTKKKIVSFNLNGLNPPINGTIDETNHLISIRVPYGTDTTHLTPSILFQGSAVSPASDVVRNLASPVTYSVVAEDNSIQMYTINVTSPKYPSYFYNGLVSAWLFDEGSGSTASDLTGTNTEVNNGATWTTATNCISGSCMSFNGNSYLRAGYDYDWNIYRYINIGPYGGGLPLNNNPRTIMGWIKTTSIGTKLFYQYGNRNNGIYSYGLAFGEVDGNAAFCIAGGCIVSNKLINDGNWHHYAFTYSNSLAKIYIDSVEIFSQNINLDTGSSQWDPNYQYLSVIGAAPVVPTSFWNGQIDELSVHNRALSGAEVNATYQYQLTGNYICPSHAYTGDTCNDLLIP